VSTSTAKAPSGTFRRRASPAAAAALVLCGALATAALAASTNFVEAASSPEPAGSGPWSVAAADLDGDGDQDLAVANTHSDDVTILRNTGKGNFNQPLTSPKPAGNGPSSVAAADLDGDADQDLAVANYNSDDVTILRNTGRGNFNEPLTSPKPVGDAPNAVVAADLDGDADQDLAVANYESDHVTILRNNGRGNFSEPVTSPEPAGDGPASVAAVDLDGDADRDLAVANFISDDVTILLNKGNGNFNPALTSPEPLGCTCAPTSVVAADLDGDADQDLALANYISNDVTILRNNGSGNFNQPVTSPEATGSVPVSVAAADFDGDADQDLAVANHYSDDVTILRNTGSGNFNQPVTSPETAGDFPQSVAAADFDGDGDPDLAVANSGFISDDVTILRNR